MKNAIIFGCTNYQNYIQYSYILLKQIAKQNLSNVDIIMLTYKAEFEHSANRNYISKLHDICPQLKIIFVETYQKAFSFVYDIIKIRPLYVKSLLPYIIYSTEYDKVLVLDTDIEIRNDLSIMFKLTDLASINGTIDVIEDFCKKQLTENIVNTNITYNKSKSYINAGILLYDINRLKNVYTLEQIQSYIQIGIITTYLAKTRFGDQDVINLMFSDIKTLSPIFNCRFQYSEHKNYLTDAVIYHYCELKTRLLKII